MATIEEITTETERFTTIQNAINAAETQKMNCHFGLSLDDIMNPDAGLAYLESMEKTSKEEFEILNVRLRLLHKLRNTSFQQLELWGVFGSESFNADEGEKVIACVKCHLTKQKQKEAKADAEAAADAEAQAKADAKAAADADAVALTIYQRHIKEAGEWEAMVEWHNLPTTTTQTRNPQIWRISWLRLQKLQRAGWDNPLLEKAYAILGPTTGGSNWYHFAKKNFDLTERGRLEVAARDVLVALEDAVRFYLEDESLNERIRGGGEVQLNGTFLVQNVSNWTRGMKHKAVVRYKSSHEVLKGVMAKYTDRAFIDKISDTKMELKREHWC